MKKRICFVDDEPQALESLRQSMSDVGGAWECDFVQSGEDALVRIAAETFDAVVTNIRLPGINGVELLQEVGSLQPKTLRFILGDVADQSVVVNCLGGTHQFLARPCPAEALVSIVQRSLALDAWLSTDQLRKLVPRLQRLPSLPSTYFELLMQIESPHASAELIAEVVSRDPAATARLLQVVNSAALALRRKITDPTDAVAQLGVETVKSIVLCVQVFDPHDHALQVGFSFDSLWSHSLSVATIARNLMSRLTHDSRAANEAFTAGLLHDVGRIVLASNLPEEYTAIIAAAKQNQRSLDSEETAQLVSHAQVGAYLLGLWGMPAHLVEATALHHTPDHKLTREFAVLTAVHIADVLAHETESTQTAENQNELPRPQLNTAYLASLNLPTSVADWEKELAGDTVPCEAGQEPGFEMAPSESPEPSAPVPEDNYRESAKVGWLIRFALPVCALILLATWGLSKVKHPATRAQETTKSKSESSVSTGERSNPDSQAGATAQRQSIAPASLAKQAPEELPGKTNQPAPRLTASKQEIAPTKPAVDVSKPSDLRNSRTKAVARGFDSVKVQAIFYKPDNPRVMINGNMFGCGDRINDVQVEKIGLSGVTLTYGGEQREVRIK